MSSRLFVRGLLLAVLGAGFASAQTAFPFNLFATANGITNNEPNNATIGVSTGVGTQITVDVRATYIGTSQATITSVPLPFGSTEFTLTLDPTDPPLPFMLSQGQSFIFHVKYAPQNVNSASAEVTIPFTEPGAAGMPVQEAISLLFQGSAPAFTLSYTLTAVGNSVQIPPGGTIPFPPTQINTKATATLAITNTGSGPGQITAISQPPATSQFSLSGIPLLPAGGVLIAGQQLMIGVTYAPTAVETDTAQFTITYFDGTVVTVILTGSGATSSFTYSYLSGTGTTGTPVKPSETIVLPDANAPTAGTAAGSSSVILQIVNSGNANGTINSVNWTGPFQVTGQPITPPTLKPGDTESVTITFTPTQVGPQTGTLVVGSDVFTLSGNGLGAKLSFSYVSPAGTIPVVPPNAVIFLPVAISQSEKVSFIITNSGTLSTTISNVVAASPFVVTGVTLPLTLAKGQSSQFSITFTPVAVGLATGMLQIDNTTVPLSGSGTAPPVLPSYTFTGPPSGNVAPSSLAQVGLTLAKGYPLALNGVLTLTTSGDVEPDQSVQFLTGGRTVSFVIPANSTSANFAGQGSQILLQTGTVAETIVLTSAFETTAGLNLTPDPATTLDLTVPAAAPTLLSLQITGETTTGFTLQIIGYSTPRSLTSLNVTFNARSGSNVGTSQFMIDVSSPAALWFQSTASQAFGGQFEISLPFVLTTSGTLTAGTSLIQDIASASVTVSNSVGTSNSLQTNVQ